HVDALEEPRAHGLGKCLLGGEALGVCPRAGERALCRLGPLDCGEAAPLEPLSVPLERGLDALDAAQVGAHADDHRAESISSRIRRTAGSRPTKTASPIR